MVRDHGLTNKIREEFLAAVMAAVPAKDNQITILAGDLNIRDEKDVLRYMTEDWSCCQGKGKKSPDWICIRQLRAQVSRAARH